MTELCVHQGTALYGLEGLKALLQGLDRVRPQIDHTLPSRAAEGDENCR